MKNLTKLLFFLPFIFLCISCKQNKSKNLIIFSASFFSPILDEIKTDTKTSLNLNLNYEISGSQVVCRKVTELGRECDIMITADHRLFNKIAKSHVNWRIDFANDEIVLGVGKRAKYIDQAEKNWPNILLKNDVEIGRVSENLGPIGYRTLIVWKLKEKYGYPYLMNNLKNKSNKIVEHVSQLAAILKAGDVDYGFLYQSACIKYDIRYIDLDKKINLGSSDIDYSSAEVSFKTFAEGKTKILKIKGSPITYSLTIPINAPNKKDAYTFIKYLLTDKKNILSFYGLKIFKPKFYGSKKDFEIFKSFAEYNRLIPETYPK
ncbi:substrate-binding domain-containing protein [bacterium]